MTKEVIDNNIRFSLLTSSKEFFEIKDRWNSLLSDVQSNNVYLTWEWLFTWWDVYKGGRELFILLAKKDDQLVGIMPLALRNVKHYRVFSFQRLEFLSTGELDSEESCPTSMSIIALEQYEKEICNGFVHYLTTKLYNKWDELCLLPLFKGCKGSQLLIDSFGRNNQYSYEEKHIGKNIYTEMEDTWDLLLGQFGKKTRKKLRKGRRVLADMEGFSYRFLDSEDDLPFFFDSFVRLHIARWDGKGAFSSRKFLAFQREISKIFFRKGYLKISLMDIDGRIVAGNLDYQYGNTIFGYQTAFDPKYHISGLSIGFMGMSYCLEDCIKSKYQIYDWYRAGGKNDYKNHFNPVVRDVISVRFCKKSFKEMVLAKVKMVESFLKILAKKVLH